ncbi:hypothetical protein Poli38472_012531 [Pythium oligandrum]|uniref:BZIP domain-containing protein n=1 Tax=Pythium oligandrum TaxID=41045 RepID=A0A8K1CEI3_PYTOL|nr:hypothetical protein Poli38472_012531 [Pythium oligandrum]|eukprot:TMW61340.1 hypothetical protein Poli38472_012531 [Pythium oligandrum]
MTEMMTDAEFSMLFLPDEEATKPWAVGLEPPLEVVPTAAESAVVRRRERHREAMARYRKEKRKRLEAMKIQVETLQRLLIQALGQNKHLLSVGGDDVDRSEAMRVAFTELVRTREALAMEKIDLTTKVGQWEQRTRAFQSVVDQMLDKTFIVSPRTPDGVWLRYRDDEAPFFYTPLQEDLCRHYIREGLRRMAKLLEILPQQRERSQCLGWETEQAVIPADTGDQQLLLYRFLRRFDYVPLSITEFQERAWQIYSTPDLSKKYSGEAVRAKLVQHISDDLLLMVRNAPEQQGRGAGRYLTLNARMPIEIETSSAAIVTLLMNKTPTTEQVNEEGGEVTWMKDGAAILRFTDKVDSMEIEYMGFLEAKTKAHAHHMWSELCQLLLRWELAVVPQRLLINE